MESLNVCIRDYTQQLQNGRIQEAFRGILSFMSALARRLEAKYPAYSSGALYPGLMDMTYFALTPTELKDRKLKVALVYLHAENRFEAWLCGANRRTQAQAIRLLGGKDLQGLRLSGSAPGVDSILESVLADGPDFDHPDALMDVLEAGWAAFIARVLPLVV